MKELTEIVNAWESLCRAGQEAVLATVVQVSGSTYRRPGARMLLTPQGRLAGSVSGGCLEGDLLKKAWWRTRAGAALVTYDSTDEDDIVWGFGLGCNGIVQVLLERVSAHQPGPLNLLRDVLRLQRSGVIATIIGGEGNAPFGERLLLFPDGMSEKHLADASLANRIDFDAQAIRDTGGSRTSIYEMPGGGTTSVFLEAVHPPLPLVIFGTNHDAVPLVKIATEMGWNVTVVETRGRQARPERFPGARSVIACPPENIADRLTLDARTAAVVMSHNYPDDRRILPILLASPVGYIGQLGPKARTERLLAEISDDGFEVTQEQRNRLHGPIGLDLGADTPEEIALAIIAEIQAAQAGRAGGLLRDRRAPLHPQEEIVKGLHSLQTERAVCRIAA